MSQPLRVLSISTLFPNPARPAFGRFVASQMTGLAERGDVDLVMVNPIGVPPWPLSLGKAYAHLRAVPAESRAGALRVLHPRFTLIPRYGAETNPRRIASAVLPLARALHAQAPFDLVDAQFFFPDGPAAAAVARELGLPLSIKARGSDIHYWSTRPRALEQMLDASRQAGLLLAVSEALGRDMAALGMPENRIRVHYTGLDTSTFRIVPRDQARARIAAPEALGLPADGPLVVTPGALIPIKGQRHAIEAMAQLPGVQLALAGQGEDREALAALAQGLGVAERVYFLGQVGHDLLPLLLSAADVVTLPSEREGLANAWIEALACGTPLVIPDIGGAREVVRNASAGRLAERTPQAIAEAIRALIENPLDPQAVAANVEAFSWENNAAQLAAHFRALAGKA